MADNSQYPFGMDWYEGNTIKSFPALVAWDQHMRFAYFRLGIGFHPDDLTLFSQCALSTDWDLGGFYEVGLPVIPKDSMVKVLLGQLAKVGASLKLPVSLAFEPQGWNGKIPLWPSVGDLKYIAAAVVNAGYRVNIYTNQSGLDIIKASKLIDMTTADWWYSSTYAFPLWSTERGVGDIVTFLQTKYGIQHEHVQFIQTLIDHGNSPIGTGQDFDRAVAWSFGEDNTQPPAPTPGALKAVDLTVISDGPVELDSITGDGVDLKSITSFQVIPFPVVAPPIPQPPAGPDGNIYRILNDWELPAQYGRNGMSRTALPDWGGNPITPETCRLTGTKTSVAIPDAAQKLVHALNDPNGEFTYVTASHGGWVNKGVWPDSVECLTFSNNIVDVIKIDGNKAYIRTWKGETDDPCVIHIWVNIGNQQDGKGGYRLYGGWKGVAKIVLAYDDPVWVELDKLVKI